uniref:VWFA domain-containing protein n=1 Tax=Panagrolaimus sp. PS1159 TaxID=55785 RepID=A0AC35GH49_9BILA
MIVMQKCCLPANDDVKVAVFSFGPDSKLVQEFTDPQIFEVIESLQTIDGKLSYAKAVRAGLDYYNSHKRSDARGVFIIFGSGKSTDKQEERSLASNFVRNAKGLECRAVYSGKEKNENTLKAFTGDVKRVYDRNPDFAKELLRLATL